MRYIVGVDTSTTSTKALVVDQNGSVVATGDSAYGYETPFPTWSEQDPGLWWSATVAAISSAIEAAGVDPSDIEAVGLTGQMHGSVLLDDNGDVVRPALLWNDQRTADECDEIRERVGRGTLIAITGNDAITGFTSPKLLWVRNHEPELWDRIRTVLLPKDYVRLRLTDVAAVDVAGGSGTGLFDLAERTWSTPVLEALDLDRGLFPEPHEGPEITGRLSREAAVATGLLPGTPVVAGGGDQSANAVGVGAISSGIVALSLGTSGVVFATTDGPSIDQEARVQAFCHAVPERWHMMGVMLSAAGSLRWFRDTVAPNVGFADLVAAASEVPAGSEGLFFLPYLSGERTPHLDATARGAFVGLTTSHDLRHLTRAVLEGVAFGLRDGLDLMMMAGVARPDAIRASGGGTRSGLWRQILADVLEARIDTVTTEEGAAYGAALLASVGGGLHDSVDSAVEKTVRVEPAAEPGADAGAYRERHRLYQELYPALRPIFHGEV